MTDLLNEIVNYIAEHGDCESETIAAVFNVPLDYAIEVIKHITYE